MKTVVYFNKGKMLLLCIGCLLFVSLTPLAIVVSKETDIAGTLFRVVWATANLLFFGTGFLWSLRAVLYPVRGALVITEKGIIDNASAFSAGFIPWEAMQSITVGPVVTITIKDYKSTLWQLPTVKRWFQSTNAKLFGGVMFSSAVLNTDIATLEAVIKAAYDRWSEPSSID